MDPNLSRLLIIDLSSKTFRIEERTSLFEERIGGAGVAIRLLHEFCPKGTDPLGPDNPIILAVGSLSALFPLASKCVAMFKSPLTGNLGESHAGGRTATSIRMAGFGAIVITGKSSQPVYLSITHNDVQFLDARSLWGMARGDTIARIIRTIDGNPGTRTILRIGRAGEQLVRYAAVTSETYRHFGRMGLGAVFGSKLLKAIVISGDAAIPVNNIKGYRLLYDQIFDAVTKSPIMKKYHDVGTAVNVLPLKSLGSIPIKNLTTSQLEKSDQLTGEEFVSNYLARRLACSHCPVSCIHLAQLRTSYPHDPYFFKTTSVCYDYELIYSLGFTLGIANPKQVLSLIDEIEGTGMDAMSSGVVAAYVTEAMKNGLITSDMTGGIELEFGDTSSYMQFFKNLADQQIPFYKNLGKGVDYTSQLYGGSEYALAFGKNEMPGYHTGLAAIIGYLTGARHSHLDSAGYSVDQKPKQSTPEEIATQLYNEEAWRQILASLVICFFARGVYSEEMVQKCLEVSGISKTIDDLVLLGKQILYEKYQFKFREGFSFRNMRIPSRITTHPSGTGLISEKDIRKGIETYENLLLSSGTGPAQSE
ncbi:aldehyde ferredoxin oxidoreductase N-terminal domain-containing protein [Methanospirillum lacunae]|uniref:Aldehyde:ferredoxin oxidoreductase n=1 Tax=Methanospirillum lacunae TaxID=668570 RepID=A0A2V2N0F2_9EURY|nr:aldehyde ferredoxin oxidoreductase N-terminal domain-containing protein [Methanospirillum lacunae]PWR69647.1 aldehyde:ferredoxin oxidoreductase [Methanospirillum lacunae]